MLSLIGEHDFLFNKVHLMLVISLINAMNDKYKPLITLIITQIRIYYISTFGV